MKFRRILLLGATGVFGQRLARLLAGVPDIELILTSRSTAKAEALATSLRAEFPAARITGEAIDTARDIEIQFQVVEPWLVIDTSGPFQGAPYATAGAALKSGAHWIDIADASDYIVGFGPALDHLARSEALSAFAGASTTPALSSAVAADLTRGWQRVDTIDIGVRPGGSTKMGRSVIQAVLSYAGLPVALWNEGGMQSTTGWGWPQRRNIPGIGTCFLSAVETADASLMPQRFAVTSRVAFRFGLNSRVEHFGLALLGALRQRGWLSKLQPLAPALETAHGLMSHFGSGTGGMTVEIAGVDGAGLPVRARWSLLAKEGDGPNVPILPALALTRALLTTRVDPGARPADASLALAAIEAEMRPLHITTAQDRVTGSAIGLFERAMGPAQFAALAPALKTFHAATAPAIWHGRADVQSGSGLIARALAWVFGFPPTGHNVPLTVSVERDSMGKTGHGKTGHGETWTRNFSGRRFSSRLATASPDNVSEQFGPFQIHLGLEASGATLAMPVAGWRLGPLPLPQLLAPKSDTREYQDDEGRFRFDVRISAPLVGQIAHYRGWLRPGPG